MTPSNLRKVIEYFPNNSGPDLRRIATLLHNALDKEIPDSPGLERNVDFHSGTPEEGRIISHGCIRTGIIGQEQKLLTRYNGRDNSIAMSLPNNLYGTFCEIVQSQRN